MNLSFLPESEYAQFGVFSFLTKRSILKKFLMSFGSPSYGDKTSSDNIFNLDSDLFYSASDETANEGYQHVGFSFVHHKFIPIAYTLSQYKGLNLTFRNYSIEAAENDDSEWEVISSKYFEDEKFCKTGLLPTIYIEKKFWKPYSKFRMVNQGNDCAGTKFFRVGGMEFFGQLIGSCDLFNPCSICKKNGIRNIYLFFVIILLRK